MKNLRERIFVGLSRVFLSKEAQELSKEFNKAGIKGAKVGRRCSFSVDAKYIQQSQEFKNIHRK